MKIKGFRQFIKEDRAGWARLIDLGLARLDWRLDGEIGGISTDEDLCIKWRGPAGEKILKVEGTIDDFISDYVVELSNGSDIKVDLVISQRSGTPAYRVNRCTVTIDGEPIEVGVEHWCQAVWQTRSAVMPALNLYTERRSARVEESGDPFANLDRLIELGVGPEDASAMGILTDALQRHYAEPPGSGIKDIWWDPDAGRGEVVLQVDFKKAASCKLMYAGNDRFMWIANFLSSGRTAKEFLASSETRLADPMARAISLARALWGPSIKFLDGYIESLKGSRLRESEDLQRLFDLGLADPVEAAAGHLIKISRGTGWPLTELTDIGEEDEDSGERYFVPIGPGFNTDPDSYNGVDWSLFTVGIEPDGGVNFYYDSAPQSLERHHSEAESRLMNQTLGSVPVPFNRVDSSDWNKLCSNIAQNNNWNEDED